MIAWATMAIRMRAKYGPTHAKEELPVSSGSIRFVVVPPAVETMTPRAR
jgi:hypothetical protein